MTIAVVVLAVCVALLTVGFGVYLFVGRGRGSGDGLNQVVEGRVQAAVENLKSANETLLSTAEEKFDKHNRSAKESVDSSVKPVRESLDRLQKLLHELDSKRKADEGALKKEIELLAKSGVSLRQETNRLTQALRSPKTRGRWGELQLRNIFELAGMTQHVDFEEQSSLVGDLGNRLVPDAIVHIPNGKQLVIDAKTPLDSYLKALEAPDEEQYRASMRKYASDITGHIATLGSKEYARSAKSSLEFVVMFVPGDSFLASAAEFMPNLVEDAYKKRVIVCTPATLIALLKAVAYGWQQQNVAQHADEILKSGVTLLQRLSTYRDHFGKIGKSLDGAINRFNDAVASFDRRVLPAARRIEQLAGQQQERQLGAEPEQIVNRPRITSSDDGADN